MSFNLTTSAAIISKAGANASAVAVASGALMALWCDQAEATFCMRTRKDWVTDLTSVTTNFKPMISDAVSDMAAIKVVNYDMSGYTSKREAETILDVLDYNAKGIIKDLSQKEFQEVID